MMKGICHNFLIEGDLVLKICNKTKIINVSLFWGLVSIKVGGRILNMHL